MNSKLTLPCNRDSFTADIISLMACKHSRLPVSAFLAFTLSPQQRRGMERRGVERRGKDALGCMQFWRGGTGELWKEDCLLAEQNAALPPKNKAELKGGWESKFWGALGEGMGDSLCITSHSLHGSPWFTSARQGHSHADIKYMIFFKQFEILNCSRIAELALER